jgi:hypothetical protein
MNKFIQSNRIMFILISCALILSGLAFTQGRYPEPLFIFFIPGALLGVFLFLTSENRILNKLKGEVNGKENSADELLKWNQLKESGVISDVEFESKKKEILNQ